MVKTNTLSTEATCAAGAEGARLPGQPHWLGPSEGTGAESATFFFLKKKNAIFFIGDIGRVLQSARGRIAVSAGAKN